MNKPEKKICSMSYTASKEESYKNIGYNQAIDDYEKFLPTEDDLRLIISEFTGFDSVKDKLSNILSKRIRGEK